MPKYIIDIPEDRVTSDGKLRFMACIDSPLANWIHTGIFAEPFDCKAIEDEVWRLAREIAYEMSLQECIDIGMLHDDDIYDSASGVLEKLTYQEAKEKYEAWKKQKDEIHVGDEVTDNDLDDIGVVTYVDDSCYCILWSSGVVSEDVRKSKLRSTGRHFNITHELLKKMKEQ